MQPSLEPTDIQILRGMLRRLLDEMRAARGDYAGTRGGTAEPSRRWSLDRWLTLQRRANMAQAQLLDAERRQRVSLKRVARAGLAQPR
ncbi:MAG: hypothetical protein REJ50_27125 [Bordetella sp.]|nr:hypothetical protein [Bordetella sp.]